MSANEIADHLMPELEWLGGLDGLEGQEGLEFPWWQGPVCLVRMDKLPYGGGNKVPRMLAWLAQQHWPNEIVAMSDAGSHTFLTLLHLLNSQEMGVTRLTLLSRGLPSSPYAQAIDQLINKHPRITVIRGSSAALWARLQMAKLMGGAVLPVGAATPAGDVIHHQIADYVVKQVAQHDRRQAIHLLPVSSGVMLAALAQRSATIDAQQSWHGLYTGTAPKVYYYYQKWLLQRQRRSVVLERGVRLTWGQVERLKLAFKQHTCAVIDPVHMAACLAWLEGPRKRVNSLEKNTTLVVWVTCPAALIPLTET